MKFCWCTLTVKNLEESLRFYEEFVGLKIDRRFNIESNGQIVFLGDGDTKLELIYHPDNDEVVMGKDITIGFEVESLEDKMKLAAENGMEIQGPFQPNPRIRFIFVKDPNGLTVQFVENK